MNNFEPRKYFEKKYADFSLDIQNWLLNIRKIVQLCLLDFLAEKNWKLGIWETLILFFLLSKWYIIPIGYRVDSYFGRNSHTLE